MSRMGFSATTGSSASPAATPSHRFRLGRDLGKDTRRQTRAEIRRRPMAFNAAWSSAESSRPGNRFPVAFRELIHGIRSNHSSQRKFPDRLGWVGALGSGEASGCDSRRRRRCPWRSTTLPQRQARCRQRSRASTPRRGSSCSTRGIRGHRGSPGRAVPEGRGPLHAVPGDEGRRHVPVQSRARLMLAPGGEVLDAEQTLLGQRSSRISIRTGFSATTG